MKKNLYNTWIQISTPKNKSNYEIFQYNKTNIWILKNHLNCFGFLLTDTISQLNSDYKNITSDWKPLLKNKNGEVLKRCLVIESKPTIDSKLFCNSIESLLDSNDKSKLYTVEEVQLILTKLEEITLKETDEFNEVVGVWGELYLIDMLISVTNDEKLKETIIESWEGNNSRSRIDFNFKPNKISIEVKTTTESIRAHRFHSLEQVFTKKGYNGFLASFCILPDDNGKSCQDLLSSIFSKLPFSLHIFLENKINLRGKVCRNMKYSFIINPSKGLEFYRFSNVPTPLLVNGIDKIEWQSILENKLKLTQNEKSNLISLSI